MDTALPNRREMVGRQVDAVGELTAGARASHGWEIEDDDGGHRRGEGVSMR